jgi:hypothetical protein
MSLHVATLPERVYRVGRAPNPWAWRDWASVGADGTFGNRWDDPGSTYRVLYAATDRLGAFLEVLATLRPDPHVLAEMQKIQGDEPSPPRRLPADWLARRRMGTGRLVGAFADVGHSESLADLRSHLAPRIVHYRIVDLDAAAIRSSTRAFTQEISRHIHERGLHGIAYLSRVADEQRLWAIFEPANSSLPLADVDSQPIATDDRDLRRALDLFDLELGP